ncbi:hypothetical protein NQ176_g7270 [Zarea fungicola]|uniref:Uncharacterized protein n=1 Tax=Zarea fungicola TaxID=93591 RepID=A0ACC1N166_9HYPO|nr:hypothetical protein NQ176_g7270 [Lecanicillium fungicola]
MAEPIAIIGSGCRLPGGADTPSKLWSLLENPRDLRSKPPSSRFNIDPFYHPVGTHPGTTNTTTSYFLEESDRVNVAEFDAGFFNIQATEAEAMDPQQRVLLEVVYDCLTEAGLPMESLRGSNTAMFAGMMCDDYNTMLTRDWEGLPRYAATGLERAIVANRVSYFFDWRGPSMTIDTACSSSLVALDQAVQTLRSGKSNIAVAAGTSLILSPDGYARGEGVAAVVMKTLSQALADNDPIICVIRETAVNQDGRTAGLTMPSGAAQAALIKQCYAGAGLDPVNKPQDRPQFFQAHGTGTQAGDPQEAEAISASLFPGNEGNAGKLLVGSIKTVIGHTEGTAGLASLIATAMALKHATIPPNLHFQTLNPKLVPFTKNLQIPLVPMKWPTGTSDVRRASVNSFGFGGTNSHCILESFERGAESQTASADKLFMPLVFSAASASALRSVLSQQLEYLQNNPHANLSDVAYTLEKRRSTLSYRRTIAAVNTAEAIAALKAIVEESDDGNNAENSVTPFRAKSSKPSILGIFTGQGAQWARMGAELIETSSFAARRIDELNGYLHSLPLAEFRPTWTLKDQLLACKETSRVKEAALSQPLCTAVQVILVDVLRAAGVSFSAVVGHSSGEISAAYAAGLVSAKDAIRIAYFRGVHAKLAASPNPNVAKGAMIAVGSSPEDAEKLCREQFSGRLQVAAVNSSSSVTLSGDENAVDEAEASLKAQGVFARKLVVDTAYHSLHMNACTEAYLASLESCNITVMEPSAESATWFSSVYEGQPMTPLKLNNKYWADNMCNTVLFSGALKAAVEASAEFDIAVELGPHPALKGPAMATLGTLPYTGLLSRGKGDVEHLSLGLGYIWENVTAGVTQLTAVQSLLSGTQRSAQVLSDLPLYPFEHNRTYWAGSRFANHFKHRKTIHSPNVLLGMPCTEATTPGEFQWRNILSPKDLPWLNGHQLQGQTVFAATGYLAMAIEAIKMVALDLNANAQLGLIQLADINISKAIAFQDDTDRVETIFSISSITPSQTNIQAKWAAYSIPSGSPTPVLNCRGQITVDLHAAEPESLPIVDVDNFDCVSVDEEEFYRSLSRVGHGYAPPFRGVSAIQRNSGFSTGRLTDQSGSSWNDQLVLHPGVCDSALQTVFAAWSYPGDTHLWSMHIPVAISKVVLNPYFTTIGLGEKQTSMRFQSLLRSNEPSKVVGDIYVRTEDSSHGILHIEGATLVPFSRASPRDDIPMFSALHYKVSSPDGPLAAAGETASEYDVQLYKDIDRVAYWFLREAAGAIPPDSRTELLSHFQKYLTWCDRMVDMVSRNAHLKVPAACNADTRQDISRILEKYKGRKDVQFVEVVGDNLVSVIRAGTSMLEHMNKDGLLRAFYEENAICAGLTGRWLSRILAQISYRYPNINILEVGAGTGATTSAVFKAIGNSYASYTFTDISAGFFPAAEDRFLEHSRKMDFKTFNMEKSPTEQGFEEGAYDVIIAVNVLHVSVDIKVTLSNIRRLLKPGGFLVVGELTSTDLLFSGMTVGTLPGWWIGADTGRPWGPLFTLGQWDASLRESGFAGIDTVTPDTSATLPMSVFVAQATDNEIAILRNPIGVKNESRRVGGDSLAIIGGATFPTYKLSQDVTYILQQNYKAVQIFEGIESFAAAHDETPTTVLCLTDLDSPYLQNMNVAKFNALKVLLGAASTLIWVTRGSRDSSPYSYMVIGLTNTIKTENPELNVQIFDLDADSQQYSSIPANAAADLSRALLRHEFLSSLQTDTSKLLWTLEPQVFMSKGKALITRLLPDTEKNERYNALRRDIYTTGGAKEDRLQLVGIRSGAGMKLELQKLSPLQLERSVQGASRRIRVLYSVLQSISVQSSGFLRLCIGVDVRTGENLLALSGSNELQGDIPSDWCIPLREELSPTELLSIAAGLVARYILSLVPPAGNLLAIDADPILQLMLVKQAKVKNVKCFLITSTAGEKSIAKFTHHNTPLLNSGLETSSTASVLIHFSRGPKSDAVRELLEARLPRSCLRLTEGNVVGYSASAVYNSQHAAGVNAVLQQAYEERSSPQGVTPVSLKEATTQQYTGEPLRVVDWTDCSDLELKVQPIDSGLLFRADATYLFVGMAGELGQSLAAWMISKGARHIVLTSRTPKVQPLFIEKMSVRHGASVQAMSLDITSRESLHSVYARMSVTMPPIAGVVNGAMILDDDLFSNMTYEQYARVTKPKVLGTELLDELFYDVPLDFFIVASSISSIIGWSGQSNYSASNECITSIVHQRRKRGLHGSAMNIPAVLGIGYAAHSSTFDFDYFQSLGYINISEHDLHVLFAETVLAGQRTRTDGALAQVAMGVNYIPVDLVTKAAHRRDIKFAHFTMNKTNDSTVQASSASIGVSVQLQMATTDDERYAVVRDAFIAHLRRMLRISEDKPLQELVTLAELGLDSLVAVDVRAWFLKELQVDIPTLKILGGGTVADMVNLAFDKISVQEIETEAKSSSPPFATPSSGTATSSASPKLPSSIADGRMTNDASETGSSSSYTEPSSRDPLEKDFTNISVDQVFTIDKKESVLSYVDEISLVGKDVYGV